MNKVIIAIIIVLIVGGLGIAVYFTTDTNKFPFGDKNKEKPEGFDYKTLNGSGVQELTEEQISELQEFFYSNPSNSEIGIYCQENRMYCRYYCSQINPNHEYCENMISQRNFNRGFRE